MDCAAVIGGSGLAFRRHTKIYCLQILMDVQIRCPLARIPRAPKEGGPHGTIKASAPQNPGRPFAKEDAANGVDERGKHHIAGSGGDSGGITSSGGFAGNPRPQ
jgi:hypothetical protein